ncbi:unnamed protein product [Miscanthus lutarioriparius]|uniref:Uncharacterized protein n=1 Tax=Miscanthus lutarioriparius TaxID=422564 RepID=A0A811QJP7_9POAL|nr:unnamed protein product [Miscanthus lutarioriparius]
MAPSNQPFTLCSILEKDKLNGTNFADWIHNLRIVLRAEKKEEILDTPLPEEPADNAPAVEKNTYKRACDADLEIQARTERFNVSKAFAETKLAEGAAVGPHVIKMVGYTQRLEKLGFPIGPKLATDFIVASLPPSYGNFIANYHMHGAEKGLNELCGMLKTTEADIKKGAGSSHVMVVQNKPKFKKKGNSWKKKKGKAKDEISKPNPPAPKAGPPANAECFHCHGKGHWKRNYKLYLESIKDRGSKGHISENRMKRLHSDGLLTSFDFESYETCEACLLGKMTKTPFTDKLTPKSDKCFFVGYPKETLGYYFYNRSEGKEFVARNGVFLEKEFLKREKSGQKVYLEEVQDEPVGKDSTSDANVAEQVEIPVAIETPPQPRRSARIHELCGDLLLLDDDEPATYAEAMMDLDSEKWQTDERKRMSKVPYASAVVSIMYAMICTHPDVSYALSVASRYQADPGESHWTLVKNILKYLRRTKDVFLIYGGEEELVVNGYTDASFQTDTDDSQSQSGFVFTINGGAVS